MLYIHVGDVYCQILTMHGIYIQPMLLFKKSLSTIKFNNHRTIIQNAIFFHQKTVTQIMSVYKNRGHIINQKYTLRVKATMRKIRKIY